MCDKNVYWMLIDKIGFICVFMYGDVLELQFVIFMSKPTYCFIKYRNKINGEIRRFLKKKNTENVTYQTPVESKSILHALIRKKLSIRPQTKILSKTVLYRAII